jgi:predicted nucleic acid-binding protein
MKGVFVDTAGWMACADGSDPQHQRSCQALKQVLTTDHHFRQMGFQVVPDPAR